MNNLGQVAREFQGHEKYPPDCRPGGQSAPQHRILPLVTTRLHYQKSRGTFGAAGVEDSVLASFETEAHNVSAHAVGRTSRLL